LKAANELKLNISCARAPAQGFPWKHPNVCDNKILDKLQYYLTHQKCKLKGNFLKLSK